MSNVVTHTRFGASVSDLREQGIRVELADSYDDIALNEPQYGETIMGELTPDERAMFAELYRTQAQLEALTREYVGAAIERFGSRIRHSDLNKPLHQSVQDGEVQMEFGTDANRLGFFRLQQQAAVLHANLYWSIGERFGCHDWRVGVRSRFRAVKVAPRA